MNNDTCKIISESSTSLKKDISFNSSTELMTYRRNEREKRRETLYNPPNKIYLYSEGWITDSGEGEITFYYNDGSRITTDGNYNIIKVEVEKDFKNYN